MQPSSRMGTDVYWCRALETSGDHGSDWSTCDVNTERDIGKWWQKELKQVMVEAGKKEKHLAEERDFHEGVPVITVIVDGG